MKVHTLPVACLMVTAFSFSGFAQSAATPDPQTLALEQRIDALERALAEVKAELAQHPSPPPTAPPVAPVAIATLTNADVPAAVSPAENDSHTLGPLQFRGYSDFTYGRPVFSTLPEGNLTNSTNGFSLGDFDLFTTARI